MALLSKRLTKHADVVKIDVDRCHNRSILEVSKTLGDYLTPLRDLYDNIALVGHSMGGVIAARLLQDEPEAATALVGIAAPMRGHHHEIGKNLTLASSELYAKSDFMSRLITKSPVQSLGLYSHDDLIVAKNSALRFFHDTQVIPWSTHATIPFMKRTYLEISAWLDYTVFDKDPTSDEVQPKGTSDHHHLLSPRR
jgi:pimeloyl-ACP methyl ester carboxylesterase